MKERYVEVNGFSENVEVRTGRNAKGELKEIVVDCADGLGLPHSVLIFPPRLARTVAQAILRAFPETSREKP